MLSPRLREEPLPPFRRPAELIVAFAEGFRPPANVSVSECAERHIRLNNPGAYVGPLRLDRTPFAVEPMDRAIRRDVRELILVGPSQTVKSTICLALVAHGIKYRPLDCLLIQPTRDAALDFSERRIENGFLEASPDLRAEIAPGRGADKRLTKTFRNGYMLTLGWAVAGQFSSRPVPTVIIDERDRMPLDIGGEGDPRALGRNRISTFGRNGVVVVVSSPSMDYEGGIVGYFYEGDQRLWAWLCPDCGDGFTPGFGWDRKPTLAHLYLPPDVSPEQAAAAAAVICPHCGVHIPQSEQLRLNRGGRWVAKGQKLMRDGEIVGRAPGGHIASYWFSGLVAPTIKWDELTYEYIVALQRFERTQDEEPLKTWTNTRMGAPYESRHQGAQPLEIEELERHRIDYGLGEVPEGVRFLVASVDSQAKRWAVAVTGFDETGRSWLVDRFDISEVAGGGAPDPANVLEHWDLLIPRAIGAAYPIAGSPDRELDIAVTVIDAGGMAGEDEAGEATEGVSLQARDFARRLFAGGLPDWRLMLIRGAPQRRAHMLPQTPKHETDNAGKRRSDSVPVYNIGVHGLKNVVANRLRLSPPQEGCVRFPREVPEGYFKELIAERRIKGKWTKDGPNESWDLAVYAEAGRQRLGPERVRDWSNPPPWGKPRPKHDRPVPIETASTPPPAAVQHSRTLWRLDV